MFIAKGEQIPEEAQMYLCNQLLAPLELPVPNEGNGSGAGYDGGDVCLGRVSSARYCDSCSECLAGWEMF